jgi:hypothetical protein
VAERLEASQEELSSMELSYVNVLQTHNIMLNKGLRTVDPESYSTAYWGTHNSLFLGNTN